MPALADSLELMLPELREAIVPAELHGDLRDFVKRLAPVHRLGFEVRLGGPHPVDVQQGIVAADQEVERLTAHLHRSSADGLRWGRLEDLVAGWGDPSSPLHAGIEDLW